MRSVFQSLFIIGLLCSCTSREIENVEIADVRYCRNCLDIRDAIRFEENIGSERENLSSIEIATIMARVVKYIYFADSDRQQGYFSSNRILFKRKSSLKNFHEFIVYDYYTNYDEHKDSSIYDVGVIDFNLGNSALGFIKDKSSKPRNIFMLKDVNKINLTDFKTGYYSILKWLYSLETDERKVVKERIKYFDHDYYSSPEVKLEEMILEDPWQEEFLFYKYELKGADEYSYFVSIEPGTFAPIHLYEKNPDYYKSGEGYYINISDMSIRIRFSSEFTGLCCKD